MRFIKSLGDGVGTAAGVAWPTFGIIFTTISAVAAGKIALILGVTSSLLFIAVIIPITIWSYKNSLDENQKLDDENKIQNELTEEYLFEYLLTVARECIFDSKKIYSAKDCHILSENIKTKIFHDLTHHANSLPPAIVKTLHIIVDDKRSQNFLSDFSNAIIDNNIITHDQYLKLNNCGNFLSSHREKLNSIYRNTKSTFKMDAMLPVNSRYIRSGIMGFCAAFGSVAGCSAGTIGMLTGIGVFAGLTAVPIVGWIVLASALVFGLTVAGICGYYTYQRDKQIQHLEQIKSENQNFDKFCHLKKINLVANIEARAKYQKKFLPSSMLLRKKDVPLKRRSNSVDFTASTTNIFPFWNNNQPQKLDRLNSWNYPRR